MRRRGLWGLLALAVIAACQERLTEPGLCPALCPGGPAEVFDTVLTALPGADSSYAGYIEASVARALLVSNGLPASENRAVYRFVARPDSIRVADTNRVYLVDSVIIALNLVARDTLLDDLTLQLYRVSPTVAAGVTFAEIEAELVEANLIGSIAVPDSVNSGTVRLTLRGTETLRTGLPADSGGVLAIGVAITAPEPTGVRLGSSTSTGATFSSFLTAQNVADTVTGRQQSDVRPISFNTSVAETIPVIDPDLLTLGGDPSSRALVRFDLPQGLEDSATIIRATLELVPAQPIIGLRTDPALFQAQAVLADLGAKSPVVTEDRTFILSDTLSPGVSDTVRLDVTNIVRLWQSTTVDRPEAVFLSLLPEAGTFMRGEFGSTRRPDIGAPRLRVTYMFRFSFENP